MKEVGENVDKGLAEVRDEFKALRNDYTRDLQRVESRLARVEGSGESKEGDRDGDGESGAGGRSSARPRRRREFPELATLEPASDDEEVFSDAWALVLEWRKLKDTHPSRGQGPGVAAGGGTAAGGGAGLAGGARADPAAGDLPAQGPGPGRPGQLAAEGAGGHTKGQEKAGNAAPAAADGDLRTLAEVEETGAGTAGRLTFVNFIEKY